MDEKKKTVPRIQTRNRVKPVSREGDRFMALRTMKCFKEMHERIITGWTVAEVAKFVQDVKGELTNLTRDQLMDKLKLYRQSLPPGTMIARRMPQIMEKAAEKLQGGLDELKELEKLYRLQITRIELDHQKEKQIGKLFPTLVQEMKEAREILIASAELKMDLGLATRHIGTMEVDGKLASDLGDKYGAESVKTVMSNPEARRKVLGLAAKLLTLGSKSSVSALVDGPDPVAVVDAESGSEEKTSD